MNKSTVIKSIKGEKGWLVSEKGGNITCSRSYAAHNIAFSLIAQKHGVYKIQHPSYLFISTISHFLSTENDIRLSLNKVYLKSVVRMLKRTRVWDNITNQDFLVVNHNNRKSNKEKVRAELSGLIG